MVEFRSQITVEYEDDNEAIDKYFLCCKTNNFTSKFLNLLFEKRSFSFKNDEEKTKRSFLKTIAFKNDNSLDR